MEGRGGQRFSNRPTSATTGCSVCSKAQLKTPAVFLTGQTFDTFSLLVDLVNQAECEIVHVDGYADVHTLSIIEW